MIKRRYRYIGRRAIFFLAVLILVSLVAAGCLGAKTPAGSQAPAPEVLVDYHRSGGIAGTDDHLVIFNNGAAVVVTKDQSGEITLNSTDLGRIMSLLDQSQFSQLQENYPSHHGSADLFRYSISYQGKTVTLEETAYPDAVGPVINALDQIVSMSIV